MVRVVAMKSCKFYFYIFQYIGLNIISTCNGITIDQFQYAASQKTIELTESTKRIGQLNCIAIHIRLDNDFDKATVSDFKKIE